MVVLPDTVCVSYRARKQIRHNELNVRDAVQTAVV
jgi:hypothetical protein